MNSRRGIAVLGIPPLIAVLLAGCSGGEKSVKLGGSPPPSSGVTDGSEFATNDPKLALLGWFDAVYQAERSLNPNHPGLAKYGQGPALAGIRQRIASFRAQGVRLAKPNIVKDPTITAQGKANGKDVTEVTVCLTEPPDDFVDAKTGRPKAPKERVGAGVITSKFVGVMVLSSDGWRIDGNQIEDVESCSTTG